MRTTMDAIRQHKNNVVEHYGEDRLLGIFCYGSQNYGISTEKSDVDTKAILVPTLQDACLRKPVSRELHLDNGEHCEVKDIRELIKMFSKQNINFLEILYTDYCWINSKYNKLWREYFVNNRERISHMNLRVAIYSMCGQAIHTLKQNGMNGKNYANSLRIYYTLTNLLKGKPYSYCIDMEAQGQAEALLAYKLEANFVSQERVNILISEFLYLESLADMHSTEDTDVMENMEEGVMALITNNMPYFDFYKDL